MMEVQSMSSAPTPMHERPLGELEVVASLTEMQSRGTRTPMSRFIHGSAEINGKIFIVGGRDKESNSLADTYLYDPVTSTCHELADMPAARCGHTLLSHNEKLVCFGGFSGTAFFNDVLVYEPKDNKWTVESSGSGGPAGRYCHSAAIVDDKMYVTGGDNHKDKLDDLWSFDIKTSKWQEMKPRGKKPPASQGASAAVHNGKLYMFGGFDKQTHNAMNDMWSFDPERNEWSQIEARGTVPNGRHGHAGVVFGDSWIIHGGRKDHGEKYNIDVYDFQFDVHEWRRLGVVQHTASPWGCPAVRFGHQAVLEPYTNGIIITGGYTHTDGVTFCPTNSIMRLDLLPTLHSVTSITSRISPLEHKTDCIAQDANEMKNDVSVVQEKANDIEEDCAVIKDKQAKIEEQIAPLLESIPKLEDAVKENEDKIAAVDEVAQDLGTRVDETGDKVKDIDDRLTKAEEDLDQLQDMMGIPKAQDSLKNEMNDVRERELPKLQNNFSEAVMKADEQQAKIDEIQDKMNDLEEKENLLEDREGKIEEKEEDLEKKVDRLEDEVEALKDENEKLKEELVPLKEKVAALEKDNMDMKENLGQLVDLSELYRRVESLRQTLEATIQETKKMRDIGGIISTYGSEIPNLEFEVGNAEQQAQAVKQSASTAPPQKASSISSRDKGSDKDAKKTSTKPTKK